MTSSGGLPTIDPKKLPSVAFVDTSVLIFAWDRQEGPRSSAAQAFLDAMAAHRKDVLVAAPSMAEYLRHGSATAFPRVTGLEVVAFDDVAAQTLAEKFPSEFLKETKNSRLLFGGYVKYDALIVACAVRYQADHFVSFDARESGLAKAAGLVCCAPSDYEAAQQNLAIPTALPKLRVVPPVGHIAKPRKNK